MNIERVKIYIQDYFHDFIGIRWAGQKEGWARGEGGGTISLICDTLLKIFISIFNVGT